MGCFNTTGFVSQLPILGGDKVVCFIAVVQKISPTGLYYPSSLVAPYFLPIYGSYNEYGYLEDIQETPITNILVKYSKEKNIEELLKKVCIGEDVKLPRRWKFPTRSYPIGDFTLLFEHEDVYNEITKKSTYLSKYFNCMYKAIDKYVKFLESAKNVKVKVPRIPFSIANEFICADTELLKVKLPDNLEKEYEGICDNYIFAFRDLTFFLFKELSQEDELTAMIEGKEELRKFLNLYALYQCIPNYFKLSKTAGEQQYDLNSFQRIHNVIGKKLGQLNKQKEQ